MRFDLTLIELFIVEGTEFSRQSAQRPDKRQIREDDIDHEPELRFLRERKILLGLALHFDERIARGEKIFIQVETNVPGKTDIAVLARDVESTTQQIASAANVPSIRQKMGCE